MIDFSSKFIQMQSELILDCYQVSIGKSLKERLGIDHNMIGAELAEALFEASAAILSHDIIIIDGKRDNVYNYANRTALQVFERTFAEQTRIPSRKSVAEGEDSQLSRNTLLTACFTKGWVKFDATRVSATGKTVQLKDAILYNLFDKRGIYYGQAVVFDPKPDS